MDILTYFRSLDEDTAKIDVSFKSLTYLPPLSKFKKLKTLNCSDNLLTELPDLPEALEVLYCNNNKLKSLPELPHLWFLNCHNNSLKCLPELPLSLVDLYVGSNEINELPKLPVNLIFLECYNNKLSVLPELPSGINEIYCAKNELTILPDIPTLGVFWYNPNPLIYKVTSKECINETNKKIRRFKDLFYAWKYRTKLRKWLWERVRQPRILRDMYLIDDLLEKGIDPIDLMDHLPVYHY